MSHDGASVPQYLRCLQAGATDFRAEKLQPVSRCRVHDFRKSGLLARQRSMAWLFREAGIAQVEFVQPNVELSGRQRQDARPGLAKMYRVPPDRAWWHAVGAPLERRVRHALKP